MSPQVKLESVTSVSAAIDNMKKIDASLPANDGLACFNRMYLDVTRDIEGKLKAQYFADPEFITKLDVTFANGYFNMVNHADQPSTVERAWRPLIKRRGKPGIEEIQFALAGMNAHINYDLPMAIVDTFAALHTSPTANKAYRADYQKVDGLLDKAAQTVRRSFETRSERATDLRLRLIANLANDWCINGERDIAWTNARLLWEVRAVGLARKLFLNGLACTVEVAGRTLLIAV